MKEMSPKTKTHVSNGTLQMDFLLKLFLDHIHILVLTMAVFSSQKLPPKLQTFHHISITSKH